MIVKLLAEHHLEFLSLKGGCRSSSESTLVKMSNCWKSHAQAHFISNAWMGMKIPAITLGVATMYAKTHLLTHMNRKYGIILFQF